MPLVIHNIGPRPTEDDVLDAFVILRHYRVIEAAPPFPPRERPDKAPR